MIPGARRQDLAERDDGVEHVDVADVERGEAEPQDVRGPEVADDPSRDHRLHDRVPLGVRIADLAPAALRVGG